MEIEKRTFIVTGAASGLGEATARMVVAMSTPPVKLSLKSLVFAPVSLTPM